jgi:hypothetical protein
MPQKSYQPRKQPNQRRAQVTFDAILEASAQPVTGLPLGI